MRNDFQDLQNDPLIRDAISMVGPLPAFAGASAAPGVVQPRAVAQEVIGFDLDLDRIDRNTAIDMLTRAFPVRVDPATHKPVLTQARSGESLSTRTGALPVVGKMHAVTVALRTLAQHAEQLHELEALKPCDGDACGPEALIAVIRQCVRELVQYFASGYPNPHAVNATLRTLCGCNAAAAAFPADPDALGGALGELKKRCKLDPAQACDLEGETSITNFNTLVALTAIFASVWLDASSDRTSSQYFAMNVQEVHHHLAAIVTTLAHLGRLVPASDWGLTEIPVDPPMRTSELWALMHHYCRSEALNMLRNGRAGKRAVLDKMAMFRTLLEALIGCDPKEGFRACQDECVQARLEDLLRHVKKVQSVLA